MDELLLIFLDTYFTDEYAEEVSKSFDLFDFYEYSQAFSGLIDIANDQGTISTDDLKDRFVLELHVKLDYILQQHTIKLIPEATLTQKNEILTSLGHLQKLEDYTGVIRLLESLENDEEILSTIISDSTLMDKTEVMSIIESFSPSVLTSLKQYIYTQEDSVPKDTPRFDILTNIKLFSNFVNGNALGVKLVQSGVLVGQRFFEYLTFIKDDIVVKGQEDLTVSNILSLLYISTDGFNSPLLVYRKYSYNILQDLNLVSKIEVKLLEQISKYTEFKKAHHESSKLLQTGTTA